MSHLATAQFCGSCPWAPLEEGCLGWGKLCALLPEVLWGRMEKLNRKANGAPSCPKKWVRGRVHIRGRWQRTRFQFSTQANSHLGGPQQEVDAL